MPSAPLIPLTLVGPGFAGLNAQANSTLLGPEWASVANNLVFDEANRLAARKGWAGVTTVAIGGTPEIEQLHEYRDLAGATIVVSAAANDIYSGTTTLTSRKGGLTITANNWQFQNFNGSVYGLQASHPLIAYNGSGNFASVTPSSGAVPDGNCLLAAFGRLWGSSSNGQTLKYSGLLDAADWGGVGAGSITLTRVWTDGVDQIQAVASFNNYLVVFGKRHVIFFEDGTGSSLGLDPANIQVADIVSGIGCVARDSVQSVLGDDLLFLGHAGLYSVRRVIQQSGNPLSDASKNIRTTIVGDLALGTTGIRSVYSPNNGFYLLLMPLTNKVYCFDTRFPLPDGSMRATTWDSFIPSSLLMRDDGKTLYCGKAGKIFSYSTYLDNGAAYRAAYNSGWLTLNDEVRDRVKMLKNISAIVYVGGLTNILFRWGYDFRDISKTITKESNDAAAGGEWNVGEWGLMEFGGGASELNEITVPTTGSGQFIKVGIEADVDNVALAIQQLQIFAKVGRIT